MSAEPCSLACMVSGARGANAVKIVGRLRLVTIVSIVDVYCLLHRVIARISYL